MKKALLGAIAAISLSSTAFAADLPARTYSKAPAPVVTPVYNWGGFYLGVNGGGGSVRSCWTAVGTNFGALNPTIPEGCHSGTGGTVGGQVGYRWQATNWVFGVEAQGNWANFKGSNLNNSAAGAFGQVNDVTKTNAFGLFTGQVGYAFNNVLIYGKGGAAVVADKYSEPLTALGVAAAGAGTFVGQNFATGSETRWGGAVGAGIEFGFAPNWSVGLEYDHIFTAKNNVTLNLLPPFPAWTITHNISQDIDIGMVRVNYTFGGPVIAKY
jgi:outer membrane immunogenic protein